MVLDPDICYRALRSRDSRFDGRFFAAVVTTGVYCRPICPAPKPKRRNVLFFACAAAAEEEGFRPCMRCRPEASPGTPAWAGTSTTVARGLRLISEGYLDDSGVDDLADRLGVGSRHLRRLFIEHLGATPTAVAQSRRVHFAKLLLDSTALPVTEVALYSGFSSIRRFNDAFRGIFGRTPTDVRRGRRPNGAMPAGRDLELLLAFRPPFNWSALLGFLRFRAIPGVESVEGDTYQRTVRVGDSTGTIGVRLARKRDHLLLSVPASLSRDVASIVERVRRLFDLKADPTEIAGQLGNDAMLVPLLERFPGLRVPGVWDPFETSVRAILGQQVSVKAATTISGRIVAAYGEPLDGEGRTRFIFPTAKRLSRARFNKMGITEGRARAIRALAGAVHNGSVSFDGALGLERAVGGLVDLQGIGPWTAQYIAMRAYGEPDAFPSGDLALRRAAADNDPSLATESALVERAEAWRPWRAYATMYLWADYTERQSGGAHAGDEQRTKGN